MTTETEKKTTPKKTPSKRVAAKRGTRLTESEKAEAIALWERGDTTLADLEKRFGRSQTTFQNLFKDANVTRGSKAEQVKEQVTQAVNQDANHAAVLYAQRVRDTKERRYKMNEALGSLATSLVAEARTAGKELSTQLASMKMLQVYGNVLKQSFDERYVALSIDPNDSGEDKPLPELVVQELTADQIAELIANQRVGADDEFGTFDMDMGDEEIFTQENDKVETNE